MTRKGTYKMLAVVLTVCLLGTGALPAFGHCSSPCCGPTECHPRYESGTPHPVHFIDFFLTEIRQPSCEMNSVQPLRAALVSSHRVPQTELPVAAAYAAPYHSVKFLFNPPEGPVMTWFEILRAAPDTPLYLQNLAILI